MPNLTDALDIQRYDELARQADMGLNLWSALKLAAERGDGEIAAHHVKQLIILTRTTAALVKRLGNPEPDTPFARDAKAWRAERDDA